MVERINENLILMNLRMVYFEDIHDILLRWMPNVKQVRSYCRVWIWEKKVPPNCDDPVKWKDIECLKIDVQYKNLQTLREKAIGECDPNIPTICFLETPEHISKDEGRDEPREENSQVQYRKSENAAYSQAPLMEQID